MNTKHFTILPGLYEATKGKAIIAIRKIDNKTTLEINVNELELG